MRILGTLLAVALLSACSADEPDPEPEAAPSSSAATPTPSAAPPVRTIPAGLRLPHQDAWPGFPTERILSGECLDPPRRLRPVPSTDSTDIFIHESGNRREALAVFASAEDAAEEIARWQGDLELCGHGRQSHTGELIDWYVEPARVAGADEAWHAHQLSEGVDDPTLDYDLFVTVARVGNAIYAEGLREPGHLTDARIALLEGARSRAVALFLPELDIFRAG